MKRMVGIAVLVVASAATTALAQQVTLRWGDVVPATHPSAQMIERIAADVKAKSNGRIAIQAFPGGQLGGSRDMIDAVGQRRAAGRHRGRGELRRLGAVDLDRRSAVHLARRRAPGQGDERADRRAVQRRRWSKARGMRILGTTYYGTRHITTSTKEVKAPADLVGLQAARAGERRVQGDGRGVGRRPTPMNFGELYLALKQNVVDGQENPLPTIKSGKFEEVQKYLVLTGAHHHAAARRRERGVLAGPAAGRPQDHRRRGQGGHRVAERGARRSRRGRWSITFKAAGMTVITPDVDAFRGAGGRQGAEAVRVEVGRGHVREDPGDAVAGAARCRRWPASRRARSTRSRSRRSCGMFLCVFVQVVLRYVFDRPLVWSDELARYLFVWCAFLGWVIAPDAARTSPST